MQRKIQFLIISLIGLLVLPACGFGVNNNNEPALKLNVAPGVDGLIVGQVVNIQAIAIDDNGVARVELLVDDQLLAMVPISPAVPT